MNIKFEDLRRIKHSLPSGSVNRIASELNLSEQSVRNFFGGKSFQNEHNDSSEDWHWEQGPGGGVMTLSNTQIFDAAMRILFENGKIQLQN